jgi:hypothetical protein
VARHRDTGRFNLRRRNPAAPQTLQAVFAEADCITPIGITSPAAPLLLAVLYPLWHQWH